MYQFWYRDTARAVLNTIVIFFVSDVAKAIWLLRDDQDKNTMPATSQNTVSPHAEIMPHMQGQGISVIRLIAYFRFMRVLCHIIYGLLLACLYPLLHKSFQYHIVKNWSRELLQVMHVGLAADEKHYSISAPGQLLVANHISWLDAVALNAVTPCFFVAKAELLDWPLLGWICERIGTLFIKRDARRDAARINQQIAAILRHGENIALFPEGTTTDGTRLDHFHSSLLQGAIDVEATVCPVVIHYCDNTGHANNAAAFVGEMTFVQSLWKIVCSPSLHIMVSHLPPLAGGGKTRRELAAEAQKSIAGVLLKLLSGHPRPVSENAVLVMGTETIQPIYSLLLGPVLDQDKPQNNP